MRIAPSIAMLSFWRGFCQFGNTKLGSSGVACGSNAIRVRDPFLRLQKLPLAKSYQSRQRNGTIVLRSCRDCLRSLRNLPPHRFFVSTKKSRCACPRRERYKAFYRPLYGADQPWRSWVRLLCVTRSVPEFMKSRASAKG